MNENENNRIRGGEKGDHNIGLGFNIGLLFQ